MRLMSATAPLVLPRSVLHKIPSYLQLFNLQTKKRAAALRSYTRSSAQDNRPFEDGLGSYSVVLPPEPFIYGTDHITRRSVPAHIPLPPYIGAKLGAPHDGDPWTGDGRILHNSKEEHQLRLAAQLAKNVLNYAATLIQPGVTTDAIDATIHDYIIRHGAYPSPLGYAGFPKSCCTSVNNIIAHGIPDERSLEDGDIVNVDITVFLNGFHGDTSRTFLVGDVDEAGRHLVDTSVAALDAGINACGPGKPFRGIAHAIHEFLLKSRPFKYYVSPLFTGHGIGTVFHRPPWVIHDLNNEPETMQPGHVFTIEPCIVQGEGPASGFIWPDGWTASTEDCARSAQAEHMVLITDVGVDVLTR